jgi:hypothetical protein
MTHLQREPGRARNICNNSSSAPCTHQCHATTRSAAAAHSIRTPHSCNRVIQQVSTCMPVNESFASKSSPGSVVCQQLAKRTCLVQELRKHAHNITRARNNAAQIVLKKASHYRCSEVAPLRRLLFLLATGTPVRPLFCPSIVSKRQSFCCGCGGVGCIQWRASFLHFRTRIARVVPVDGR